MIRLKRSQLGVHDIDPLARAIRSELRRRAAIGPLDSAPPQSPIGAEKDWSVDRLTLPAMQPVATEVSLSAYRRAA
jgi:hypothetical protein